MIERNYNFWIEILQSRNCTDWRKLSHPSRTEEYLIQIRSTSINYYNQKSNVNKKLINPSFPINLAPGWKGERISRFEKWKEEKTDCNHPRSKEKGAYKGRKREGRGVCRMKKKFVTHVFLVEESRIQRRLSSSAEPSRAPYTRRLQTFTDPYRSEMLVESTDRSIDRRSTVELERNQASDCNFDECSLSNRTIYFKAGKFKIKQTCFCEYCKKCGW